MRAASICFVLLVCASPRASAAADPAAVFTRKCSSCHTFGKGDLVGPDLKGATDRHTRSWLTAWIQSSESVIRSGDPAAGLLFKKYKQQRMPEQSFSAAEIGSLLDYLAKGGPAADGRGRLRGADTATAAEVEMGRSLFVGALPLAKGGAGCISCHSAGDHAANGGSLGPELTHAYSRLKDKGLSALLERGCFPRVPDASGEQALNEPQLFALRAFLRQADSGQRVSDTAGTNFVSKR
jgi:cytochrome c2